MAWTALNCPQCSAPLPRVAIWRAVKCGSCGALITRSESLVTRDSFRQALLRSRRDDGGFGGFLHCGGQAYHLMHVLDSGEISQVYLARRVGALPLLATIKLSSAPSAAKRYAREAQVLRELRAAPGAGGGSFAQLLPEVVAHGAVEGESDRQALIMRHCPGYWGSLAALAQHYPQGIDPRHAVWIWRRMLEVLGVIHGQGWAHGDVRPEHALVHPQDHAVLLIGWAAAKNPAGAAEQAADLLRSARVILVLLNGAGGSTAGVPAQVPSQLSLLVTRASEDDKFCRTQGARGLDLLLQAAAKDAFGPPKFVPLVL